MVPFIVGADGPDPMLFTALDALIAQKRVPVMIAISIGNGSGDAQGSHAGRYDTMSGRTRSSSKPKCCRSSRTVQREAHQGSRMRARRLDAARAPRGDAMAWYRNDLYHRVLSYSGTFVNQQWPYNPDTPGARGSFTAR